MKVRKRPAGPVTALCLGEGSPLEWELIARGLLVPQPDGGIRVRTRESGEGPGELAQPGDFVKLDQGGFPYPVRREVFLQTHRETETGFVAIPTTLDAWQLGQPRPEALDWLLARGRLILNESDPERCFSAQLWGTRLTAPGNAVLVFYRIDRDELGQITDVDFNFVVREEFDAAYEILS